MFYTPETQPVEVIELHGVLGVVVPIVVLPVELRHPDGEPELGVDPAHRVLHLTQVDGLRPEMGLDANATHGGATVQKVANLVDVAATVKGTMHYRRPKYFERKKLFFYNKDIFSQICT